MKPLLPLTLISLALLSGTAVAQGRGGGGPPASVGAQMPPVATAPRTIGPPTTNPGVTTRDAARADRQGPAQADEHAIENADENAGLTDDPDSDDDATPGTETREEARANRHGPANAADQALENADANAGLSEDAPTHPLTTAELNRRELARLRALPDPRG